MPQSEIASIRDKIRWAQEPDNPELISQWLDLERCQLQSQQPMAQGADSVERQRDSYERQFRLLLETVVDELLPSHWRCSCLDLIHKPLQGLKCLSDDGPSQAHLRQLCRELAVTSHYVRAGLVY